MPGVINFSTKTVEKLLTVIFWLTFFLFFLYWFSSIPVLSPNIAGVENNTIYFVQRLLNGTPLYSNPEEAPFAIAQYGPLYYSLIAGIARLTGFGPDDVTYLFMLNRAVSISLLFLTAAIVYAIGLRVFVFSRKKSLFLFAAVFIFMEISSLSRADSLAQAAYFLSLFFFLAALKNKEKKSNPVLLLVVSALVAVVALFSKQSAITLPLMCGFWLLWVKAYRYFFLYTLSFFAITATALFMIHNSCTLQEFYMNVVKGVDNGIYPAVYFDYIVQEFLATQGLLWIVAMAVVILLLSKKKEQQYRILILLTAGQLAASCIAALKYGSSSNYFAEWWVLVLLGTACCWDLISGVAKAVNPALLPVMLCIILVIRVSSVVQKLYSNVSSAYQPARHQLYNTEMNVAAYIKNAAPGPETRVFNNIFSPDSYLNNLLFRQAMIPQADIVVLGTYYRDVFDYTKFRQQLQEGSIRYMVTKGKKENSGFLKISNREYSLIKTINEYHIWQHRKYE